MSSSSPLLLHVWPGGWGLPSVDAECLEAILHLQQLARGRGRGRGQGRHQPFFSIVETGDPDASPTGRLPFLTHGHGRVGVAPLRAIVGYVEGLGGRVWGGVGDDGEGEGDEEGDGGAELGAVQSAQTVAWRAYIETQLGDLVAHSLFVLDPNWHLCTRREMARALPVPQRYYVPDRVREGYRPRLEAVGLWQLANVPEEGKKDGEMRHAFGQAKVVEKARGVLDILARLLGEKPFVFSDRPTAMDLALAARVMLLLKAPLPNSALRDILMESYSTLAAHASRTCDALFLDLPRASSSDTPTQPQTNVRALVQQSAVRLLGGRGGMTGAKDDESEGDEARRFRRYRWAWMGMALFGAVGFAVANGLVRVEERAEGLEEGVSEDISEEEGGVGE